MRWPEAKRNFDNLREIERRPMNLGDFPMYLQRNPARIRSTGAATDKQSISERPCFLCGANRPAEQLCGEWPNGDWELLVNPYPILPIHFTVVSREHVAQEEIPLDMASMAEGAQDLAIFFNGARAGASAPDHLHCQAVLKSELPILGIAEKNHSASRGGWMASTEFQLDLPFHFMSAVVTPDLEGMRTLAKVPDSFGIDSQTGEKDKGLVNAFFWIDRAGMLRIIIVPRRAHRPRVFFASEEERFVISPASVEMAGIMVVPRESDYSRLTPELVREIYSDTAFSAALPDEVLHHFLD